MTRNLKNLSAHSLSNRSHWLLLMLLICQSCTHKKYTHYVNYIDHKRNYTKVGMINLLNNIDDYNSKYVEVEGEFEFYFEKSSLSPTYFDFFRKHRRALWINLSEKNPLYLPGTNESLTESIRNIEGLNDKKSLFMGKLILQIMGICQIMQPRSTVLLRSL
jgi:hypothetical protein